MKLALAPLALAVVLAAGCGGSSSSSSEPSPKDWADGLCSAITTWSNSVKTAGETLKSGSLSEGDLKKSTSEIKSATNTFADDLKGLGKPNTDAGQQAKDAIDKLATQINDDVDTLQKAVNDAVGKGTKGAVSAASSIATSLSTMSTQIASAASKLQQSDAKGELEQGFRDAPACKKLSSS
jgi:phosphoenolpyruvate-protein kinase (PTS system EI component)